MNPSDEPFPDIQLPKDLKDRLIAKAAQSGKSVYALLTEAAELYDKHLTEKSETTFKIELEINKNTPIATVTINNKSSTHSLKSIAFALSMFSNYKPEQNTPEFLIEQLNKPDSESL